MTFAEELALIERVASLERQLKDLRDDFEIHQDVSHGRRF